MRVIRIPSLPDPPLGRRFSSWLPGWLGSNWLISTPNDWSSGCSKLNCTCGVYELVRVTNPLFCGGGWDRLVYWALNVIPATPPVGSGLARVVLRLAVSPLLKLYCRVRVGWSCLLQVMLLISRASNLLSDRLISAAAVAGSRANARMVSVALAPRPVDWLSWSFTSPGLVAALPRFPCSRAMATASLRDSSRGGRLGSRTVAGA